MAAAAANMKLAPNEDDLGQVGGVLYAETALEHNGMVTNNDDARRELPPDHCGGSPGTACVCLGETSICGGERIFDPQVALTKEPRVNETIVPLPEADLKQSVAAAAAAAQAVKPTAAAVVQQPPNAKKGKAAKDPAEYTKNLKESQAKAQKRYRERQKDKTRTLEATVAYLTTRVHMLESTQGVHSSRLGVGASVAQTELLSQLSKAESEVAILRWMMYMQLEEPKKCETVASSSSSSSSMDRGAEESAWTQHMMRVALVAKEEKDPDLRAAKIREVNLMFQVIYPETGSAGDSTCARGIRCVYCPTTTTNKRGVTEAKHAHWHKMLERVKLSDESTKRIIHARGRFQSQASAFCSIKQNIVTAFRALAAHHGYAETMLLKYNGTETFYQALKRNIIDSEGLLSWYEKTFFSCLTSEEAENIILLSSPHALDPVEFSNALAQDILLSYRR